MTPKPLWKSRYSLPSTSHTRAPSPRSTYTGQGSLFWNWEGTPPGMTALARAKYSPDRRVRSISLAFSRSVSAAIRAGSAAVWSSVLVMGRTLSAGGVRLTRQSHAVERHAVVVERAARALWAERGAEEIDVRVGERARGAGGGQVGAEHERA